MNLSIILPTLKTYGGVRRFVGLANAWVENGHKATIYTPTGEPCEWLDCKFSVKKQARAERKRHDILMFGFPGHDDLEIAKRARARVKVFYLCMIYDVPALKTGKPTWPEFVRQTAITKSALSDPEFIKYANSTWMKEYAEECFPGIEIKTLIGGVDKSIFYPTEIAKVPNSIVTPLEKRPWKSRGQMPEVFRLIRKHIHSATIHTYRGRGLQQSQMADFICSHEIFVDDTILAGWHNPVIEAMACGIPVVCYDFGAVRDFAINGKTALTVPKKNVIALANSAVRLLRDKPFAKRLADNALEYIQKFSWDSAIRTIEDDCR
jgi:hypothetical protein